MTGGLNPAGIYALMCGKSRSTYDNLLRVLKDLIPDSSPRRILTDFESAAMNAFKDAYVNAEVRGCYFHLYQSVIRKVSECGLKCDYESDNEIRDFIRCLAALSHVPVSDVIDAYELLVQEMQQN